MSTLDGFTQLIFNIYEAFTVALFVSEDDRLRCLSSVSFAGSFDRRRTVPVEGTLPGWVLKHTEPLIIPNFDKDEETLGYYGTPQGIKSFMGYPMEGKGVIVVDSKKKWVFTDKEKKILGGFVSMISEEIEREKQEQETEDRVSEVHGERRLLSLFSGLNRGQVSVREILGESAAFCGADFAFIAMEKGGRIVVQEVLGPDPEEHLTKECSAGTIVSLVFEGQRELLLPFNSGYLREKRLLFQGETIKTRQFFGFPLGVEDSFQGVLGYVSTTDSPLREGSIGLLREVAAILSLYYSWVSTREALELMKEFEPLTGSVQFTTFLKVVDRAIQKGDRFSILSVKVLHLDRYNRRMGYDFTNELLRKVSQVVRYCVGGSAGVVTRKGGGHFYVLMRGNKGVNVENILRIVHYTVIRSMPEEEVPDKGEPVESGLATFPEDSRSLWDLLEKADSKSHRLSKL
jgi:GGDEF domain-containing protein